MKNLLLLLVLFVVVEGVAQVPQQVNYQGIARNSVGSVLANQNISLRLSIHEGTTSGPVVYRETRNLKTNNLGLFVTAIGSAGAVNVSGSFVTINWAGGLKFLQVEIDPAGSANFIDMGTSQLMSVPYAIYAGAASPVGNAGGDLTGNYPSPQLKDNTVGTAKIQDGSITANKLAPGVIPSSLPASGTAGGDLTGSYPNPVIANGTIGSTKISDNAITTSKIADASITAGKLAPGVIPASLPPSGVAAGDLSGNYPNPVLATGVVTTTKLANGAVTNSKVADGAVGT